MATKKTAANNPLDVLVRDPQRALMMVLWANRFHNPELTVVVKPEDLQAFEASVTHTAQVPVVKVERPAGRPAQEAVVAQPPSKAFPQGKPAIAARKADPPRDLVVIQMVDEQGNAIRPVESNEKDYERGRAAEALNAAKTGATGLANQIRSMLNGGNYSDDLIREGCTALEMWGRS